MTPSPPPSGYAAAVAALNECSQAAADCARRCRELDAPAMATCIATCEACSIICATTTEVLQLGDAARPEIVLEQIRAAYEATRTAAIECAEHPTEATGPCADVCATTSERLKTLISDLEQATVTVRLR